MTDQGNPRTPNKPKRKRSTQSPNGATKPTAFSLTPEDRVMLDIAKKISGKTQSQIVREGLALWFQANRDTA